MKIFLAHFFHESNTFAPGYTDIERFATGAYCRGAEVRSKYKGTRHYIGGMLDRADEEGAEVCLSISVGTAGPTLSGECLDYYVDQIMEDLCAVKDSIDGVCLALHGAGVSTKTSDIEGHLLEKIRNEIGMSMPVTASLDLHANMTAEMLRYVNAYFSLKTYPHVDTYEAGYMAMDCCIRMIKNGFKPVCTAMRIPMIAAFNGMRTDVAGMPAAEAKEYIACLKEETGVYDISLIHGFCYADIPDTAMFALVVSDKKEMEICERICRFMWERRTRTYRKNNSVQFAVERTASILDNGNDDKLCVICEICDFGGAGGPNDGTHLLNEMLIHNRPKSIFVSLCDPEVAAECCRCGTGKKFSGYIGGKSDKRYGKPICVENAEILGCSDGHFRYTTPMYYGQPYCVGNTARLKIGNVEVIINSVPRQTHDDRMIAITGSDIGFYNMIGLKSAIAYKAFYEKLPNYLCTEECDAPGCSSNDLSIFTYENIRRPVYPLDDITEPKYKEISLAINSGG